jgi:2-oxoglutarate dehydrogenase E1 component
LNLREKEQHPELDPASYGFGPEDMDREIFVEFMHISTPAQKAWIQERIEGEEKDISFTVEGKKAILNKLIEAETFEKFGDIKYTGTKRFGLDGGESMVPALEQIIKRGGQLGVKEIVIGMAHRGRLNVLANVMGKPHRAIFNEFKGGSFKPDDVEGSGDVKYHLGASSDREFDGNKVHLSLTANPISPRNRRPGGPRKGPRQAGSAQLRPPERERFCRC